jgi:hypothetical protein
LPGLRPVKSLYIAIRIDVYALKLTRRRVQRQHIINIQNYPEGFNYYKAESLT